MSQPVGPDEEEPISTPPDETPEPDEPDEDETTARTLPYRRDLD